jgi:hypothetical protein
MSIAAVTAMLHVRSIPRSIAFYEKLGFVARKTHTPDGIPDPTWAWLASCGAHLMVVQASAPVDPEQQAVIFYMYCPDVPGFRARLLAQGINVGPISYPFYAPQGEFRVSDPDGYALMISHT